MSNEIILREPAEIGNNVLKRVTAKAITLLNAGIKSEKDVALAVHSVDEKELEARWSEIKAIIHSVPDYETCKAAMIKAGCKITVEDIGKPQSLFDNCVKYSPYMRKRLTLLRMKDMIAIEL